MGPLPHGRGFVEGMTSIVLTRVDLAAEEECRYGMKLEESGAESAKWFSSRSAAGSA
jgi:hypothetical protein